MSAAAPEELGCLGMSACWVRPVAMSYTMGTIMLTGSWGTGIRWVSCNCDTQQMKNNGWVWWVSCEDAPQVHVLINHCWDIQRRASWTWAPQRWCQEERWGEHWEGWWDRTGHSTLALQPGQGTAREMRKNMNEYMYVVFVLCCHYNFTACFAKGERCGGPAQYAYSSVREISKILRVLLVKVLNDSAWDQNIYFDNYQLTRPVQNNNEIHECMWRELL